MVRYRKVQEHGANVDLLEYNNIEGMIISTEMTRKRTANVTRHIRSGKKEPALVLKIDKEKGYMDLSRIKVKTEQCEECEQRYKKAKMVHNIVQRVAINCEIPLEKVYKDVIWPLSKKANVLEAFRQVDTLPKNSATLHLDMFKGIPGADKVILTEEVAKELYRQIENKLSRHAIRIKADFEVTCFTFEGIDAIREALLAGVQTTAGISKEETKEEEKLEVKVNVMILIFILDLLNSSSSL
jgi:translation initiation factor 2 subunit 1